MKSSKLLPGRARTDLHGRTVLLIEDDFFAARDTQQALQHAGARVVGPFADSASALRVVATREVSCAIVDVQLSDGQRFNLASALEDKGIPFVFLTALNRSVIPEQFRQVPYFQKPSDFRSLLKTTAQICSDRWF